MGRVKVCNTTGARHHIGSRRPHAGDHRRFHGRMSVTKLSFHDCNICSFDWRIRYAQSLFLRDEVQKPASLELRMIVALHFNIKHQDSNEMCELRIRCSEGYCCRSCLPFPINTSSSLTPTLKVPMTSLPAVFTTPIISQPSVSGMHR